MIYDITFPLSLDFILVVNSMTMGNPFYKTCWVVVMFFCCKKHINWFLYKVLILLEKEVRSKRNYYSFKWQWHTCIFEILMWSKLIREKSNIWWLSFKKSFMHIYIRGQWNMAVMVSKTSQCLSILFSCIIYHWFVRGFGKKWYKSEKTVCVCLMQYYNDYIKIICHEKKNFTSPQCKCLISKR